MSTTPPPFSPDAYRMQAQQISADRVGSIMKRVYLNMTLGLVISAVCAMFCASSMAFWQFMAQNHWFMWVLIIAEFGILFGVQGAINRISTAAGLGLFFLFAAINGVMLSSIFLAYDTTAIVKTFFITAGTFAAMSVYGYFTTRSLARFGSILFMALIGLIIAMVVNIFLHSSTFDFIISIFGVLIFTGLTAWDTQQIRTIAAASPDASAGRLAVLGALTLYLDFVNLFLYLLRIFGGNRN